MPVTDMSEFVTPRGVVIRMSSREAASTVGFRPAAPRSTAAPASSGRPPERGKGSSIDVWAAYAKERGVDPDGMTRGEIIAALDRD